MESQEIKAGLPDRERLWEEEKGSLQLDTEEEKRAKSHEPSSSM